MRRIALLVTLLLSLSLARFALAQDGGTPYIARYDVNRDGIINIEDVMLVAAHWRAEAIPTPTPEVRILSTNVFTSTIGSLYLVGEVENGSTSSIEYTRIGIAFEDDADRLVYGDYDYADIDIIAPGGKSPFWSIWAGDLPSWTFYETAVTDRATGDSPIPFEILNHSSSFDTFGDFHVTGQVRNQYDQPYTYVEAFVTMYDAAGKVIGVGHSYVDPDTLEPDATGVFDVEIWTWKGEPDQSIVAGYDLQVLLD
jgi:hypothetical protein